MVTYGYDDATGAKTFVTRKTATGSTASMPIGSTLLNNTLGYTIASTDVTMYIDNVVHETSTYYLDKVMISDGMLKRTNAITETTPVLKYHYFLKDHLGNVRVVFDEDGIIKQVNNYYPFGMEWGESAEDQTSMTYQDNLFGGKEFNRKFELNMYDFGARNYDGTIGRWTTMDQMAERHFDISPYAYCLNNPLIYSDKDGFTEIERIGALSFARLMIGKSYHEMDCSALVAGGMMYVGFSDPRNGKGMGPWLNGVARIVNKSRPIDINDIRAGDIITIITDIEHQNGPGGIYDHIGFVSEPIYKKGILVGLTMIDSGSSGPNFRDYYFKDKHSKFKIAGAFQWDTVDDEESPLFGKELSQVTVEAQGKEKTVPTIPIETQVNKYGNSGIFNKEGRTADQFYSDEFLKSYYK